MKDQISAHVKDLIKRIHDEEQDLHRKIDARVQMETEYGILARFFLTNFLSIVEKLMLRIEKFNICRRIKQR